MSFLNTQPKLINYTPPFCFIVFLVWWDNRIETDTYYGGRPDVIDLIALTIGVFVTVVFLYTLAKAIVNPRCRALLIPLILYGLFQFRVLEGRIITTISRTGESAWETIELKDTGIFRRDADDGVSHLSEVGSYELRGDTAFLYSDFHYVHMPMTGTKKAEVIRIKYQSPMRMISTAPDLRSGATWVGICNPV